MRRIDIGFEASMSHGIVVTGVTHWNDRSASIERKNQATDAVDWGPENQRMRADAIKQLLSEGMTRERTEDHCDEHMYPADVRENDEYQVVVKPIKQGWGFFAGCWFQCISIMRRDRKAVQDWRDLQAIKNELFGPEYEAIELYPAESRVMDTQNQFHLDALVHHEGEMRPRFPLGGDFRDLTPEDQWQRPRCDQAKVMSRRPKSRPHRALPEPKLELWAQSSTLAPIDHTVALREELQRMRIERAGFISEIEELKAEIARLKEEAENLRVAVAALPLPPAEMKS